MSFDELSVFPPFFPPHSLLLVPKSFSNLHKALQFLYQRHTRTQVKETCHAMQKDLSLQLHPLCSPIPASPTCQAEVVVGLLSLTACLKIHMLVSQVGERLASPGIRWISDVNMWFSTLCPLWLLSASSPAPTPPWLQFCAAVLGDNGATAAPATSIRCLSSLFSED